MVVVHRGHHVARDAGVGQRSGHRRGEPHVVQVGRTLQRQPRGAIAHRQSGRAGARLVDDQRGAFGLAKGRDRSQRGEVATRWRDHERVRAGLPRGFSERERARSMVEPMWISHSIIAANRKSPIEETV